MKIPVSMLRDLVQTSLTAEQLGDLLTMAGFELEELGEVGGEAVLDVKVMANRGDGLSAMGLAREILAKDPNAKPTDLYLRGVARFPWEDQAVRPAGVQVYVETPACTRYACRIFQNVQNGTSPQWLQDRLTQAGMRPISLLVDLTNYILLEQGQPLHAFDLDKLKNATIVVREARQGEKLTTLNGEEHELQPGQMMICDAERPVAVAGVMGGLDTEVGPETRNMLLESAHFANTSVRKTRKQLGLSTEASYRFERWVDPDGVVSALNRFAELYAQVVPTSPPVGTDQGGSYTPAPPPIGIVPGVIDVYPQPFSLKPVHVRMSRVVRLLGMDVTDDQAKDYLRKLGFTITDKDPISAISNAIVSVVAPSKHGDFMAQPPTWRPDILREDDVVEEIGRVHGYDRIPETAPVATITQGGVFGLQAFIDNVRESMLRSDFHQIISHTLRDAHPLDFKDNRLVEVRNPHSPEMRYLRNSLLPGLVEAARRNGGKDLHLFEIGKVFVKGDYQLDESPELAILSTGNLYPPHWLTPPVSDSDFYSLKGVLEELGTTCKVHFHFDRPLILDPRFHPTRQASVLADRGNLHIGIFGQIHPDLAEALDLPELTMLAELDLLVLFTERDDSMQLRDISRNPAVRRDIAILIEKKTPYIEIETAIVGACGDVLEKHWLFDVYEGQGIPEGHHSLAIAMQLRKMGENMTDEEANSVRDRAVNALETLGAKLR